MSASSKDDEIKELRALLDLFEEYSEFRMGLIPALKAPDIPTIRDVDRARVLLGYKPLIPTVPEASLSPTMGS